MNKPTPRVSGLDIHEVVRWVKKTRGIDLENFANHDLQNSNWRDRQNFVAQIGDENEASNGCEVYMPCCEEEWDYYLNHGGQQWVVDCMKILVEEFPEQATEEAMTFWYWW